MSFRILCPGGHELLAELEYVGRMIRCPACKAVMVVPDPRPAPAAPPPPAPAVVPPSPPPEVSSIAPGPPPLVPQEAVAVVHPVQPPLVPQDAVAVVEPELDIEEGRPRRRKGLKTAERLERVLLGLGFHYAKLMCFLGAMIVMVASDLLLRFAVVGAAAGAAVDGPRGGGPSTGSVTSILIILLVLGITL